VETPEIQAQQPMAAKQPVKFLIIRFSSIGDIVLTTPVIRCLRQQVEGAEIHFLTKKMYLPVIEANPYIHKIHTLEDSLPAVINMLLDEGIDYIIDLHHNLRSSMVKLRLRLLSFSVNKIDLEKWLLVNLKINRLPHLHIVDRYLETTILFDIYNDGKGLDYFIPSVDEVDLASLPETFSEGYIAIVTGARHATKQLPAEKIIRLCNEINKPMVLLGGPGDRETAEHIKKHARGIIMNACGQYNLNQSASLIRQSRVVITPDTGLMHIAAAFNKIIISLWGNTIPEFGMYPYMPDPGSYIFEIKGLRCRPCSKIGFNKCPRKHFRCMNDLDEIQIADKALSLFGHTNP